MRGGNLYIGAGWKISFDTLSLDLIDRLISRMPSPCLDFLMEILNKNNDVSVAVKKATQATRNHSHYNLAHPQDKKPFIKHN